MNTSLLNLSLKYLSRRPHSIQEVRDYLIKCKLPREQRKKQFFSHIPLSEEDMSEIEIVIEKLKELRFLDDVSFANWWVEQRTRTRPKGWIAIALELHQKGISKDTVMQVQGALKEKAEQATSEGTNLGVWAEESVRDEKQLALQLAQKKMKSMQGLERAKIYQRLGGFLGRRGFSMDTIKAVFDEVLPKSV